MVPIAISDHYLILTIRKINIPLNQNRNKKIEIRNFKHFNAENFINDLQDQRWDLCDGDFSVDKKWGTWKSIFLTVLDKHAPIRIKNVGNNSSVPWLTSAIKLQIRERDRLKHFAIKKNSAYYWSAYKLSRNRVTQALREAKSAYYKRQFVSVTNNPKQAWKTVNKILNRKQECGSEINCINSQSGQITCSNELAESFNNYFTNIGPNIANTIENSDVNFMDYLNDTIKTKNVFKFQVISVTKVVSLLRSLNPCKSTGIDKIPAKIIRIAAPVIAESLTKIFNTAICSETVPFDWKVARVIPLHKSGPRNLFNNYRPVSILSVISKVFEKLLYEQLYDYFISNNLLSDRQFGFRQFHSTVSTLLDSTNEWFINMDRGKINIAVFLDLQKAFDTINHDILLKKLERYGMGSAVLNLLRNYLTDRTQMCSVNGVLSGSKTVMCGIPQCSILGPLLFLIYINDLPGSLEFSSARMFADDTTLTVSGESVLDAEVAINHDLANIKKWLAANKLSLNLVKTEYLLIGSRHNINNLFHVAKVHVGDIPIKRVKETKALGVYIDEFLSWNKHIEVISKKISSGIGAVRKLKPHVDHNTLICAYNALVLPHFDYCCEVWDTINLTLCNRLQKLQNRAARIIVGRINEHGQSELALAELNWKTLSERRAQFVASQMYKITHDLAPKRLSNIFHETPSSRHYNLRGSSTKLCLSQPKTDYLKKSLSYRGAKLWNSLSDNIRNKESLAAFKSSIRAPGQVVKTS